MIQLMTVELLEVGVFSDEKALAYHPGLVPFVDYTHNRELYEVVSDLHVAQ